MEVKSNALKIVEIDTELKLLVNERLYMKGLISKNMHVKAKELIINNGEKKNYFNYK